MRVAQFFLADAVQVAPTGKFSVLGGGIQLIAGPSFPVVQPQLAAFTKIEFGPDEVKRHTLHLRLVSERNAIVFQFTQDIDPAPAPPPFPASVTVALNANMVAFPAPGIHNLILTVDGTELDRITVSVSQGTIEQIQRKTI